MAKQHEAMMCEVDRMVFGFDQNTAHILMASDNCTDMEGCIETVLSVMPGAVDIKTYDGGLPDTEYLLQDGEWVVLCWYNAPAEVREQKRYQWNKA